MSIVGNDNAALEVEIINSNDNVKSANVSVLIWDSDCIQTCWKSYIEPLKGH